jgi:hypothetical protein
VLRDISNAILRDPRVFRIEDPDFLVQFADQGGGSFKSNSEVFLSHCFKVKCERAQWKGFSFETGPEVLQELAIERLKKEGWDSLRPALAVQIRYIHSHALTLDSHLPSHS